jgi:two-component system, chemotaxis family, chemotaxis protein CheY
LAKVLVIDDSPVVFKMIKRALEPNGFELVGQAENGQIGLEMYERYKPEIVTLDITMPVMNGIDTATVLVKNHPEANIIMLSSMDDLDLIEEAKAAGLKHFLSKPLDGEELLKLINTLLGS